MTLISFRRWSIFEVGDAQFQLKFFGARLPQYCGGDNG